MSGERVYVGYLYGDHGVDGRFADSMFDALQANPGLIQGRISYYSGPRIAPQRNKIVRDFLETDGTHLWWIDGDMGFNGEMPRGLLDLAEHHGVSIAGALCFGRDSEQRAFPTLYVIHEGEIKRWDRGWPENGSIEVIATGAACLMVAREVFEDMEPHYPEPYTWFQETQYGKVEVGEDVTFCLRASERGHKTIVHSGLRTYHFKNQPITFEDWKAEQDADRPDKAARGLWD